MLGWEKSSYWSYSVPFELCTHSFTHTHTHRRARTHTRACNMLCWGAIMNTLAWGVAGHRVTGRRPQPRLPFTLLLPYLWLWCVFINCLILIIMKISLQNWMLTCRMCCSAWAWVAAWLTGNLPQSAACQVCQVPAIIMTMHKWAHISCANRFYSASIQFLFNFLGSHFGCQRFLLININYSAGWSCQLILSKLLRLCYLTYISSWAAAKANRLQSVWTIITSKSVMLQLC